MQNILALIPFSSPWIIRHHLRDAKTVLDIACGDGSLMLKVNFDKKYQMTGVDLYKPYLKKARASGVYKELIYSDINKIKFGDNSFDVVLASQVIEHLTKKESLKLIEKLEKIARKRIILATPNGFVEYDPFEVVDGNKLQVHKSGWEIMEMRKMGYKVFGQGSGFIYRPSGLLYKFRNLKDTLALISLLLSPVTYLFPTTSACIIAVKDKQ